MTEIVYYVASSLDGLIAPEDGSPAWLAPFESSGIDYGYADFYDSVDAVIVGARTYEQALTFAEWPYPGKPTWVMSSRDLPAAALDVTVTGASPLVVWTQLERLGVRRAWLVGGGALAGAFQTVGLITEYQISFMPVLLGSGVSLLGERGVPAVLDLISSRTYPDGVVQGTYRCMATLSTPEEVDG